MSDIPATRVCKKCKEEKPLTSEFWHRKKTTTSGFATRCKFCQNAYTRGWMDANKDTMAARRRQRYRDNPQVFLERTKRWAKAHPERAREYVARYYQANKTRVNERNLRWYYDNIEKARAMAREWNTRNKEYHKQWNAEYYKRNRERIRASNRRWDMAHAEHLRQKSREWREQNPDHAREAVRQWGLNNRSYRTEYMREWCRANPEKVRAIMHRRRARKLALPDTLTSIQVDAAYDYFHNTCAICGSQLRDLFGNVKPHLDHWIALSDKRPDNPGTQAINMLPMCSPCNYSKHDSDPIVWLERKFGKRKAKAILARIAAYFDSVR